MIELNQNKYDNMLVEDAKENNLKEEEEKNEIIIPERLNTRVKLTNKIYKSDSSDEEDEEVKEGPFNLNIFIFKYWIY